MLFGRKIRKSNLIEWIFLMLIASCIAKTWSDYDGHLCAPPHFKILIYLRWIEKFIPLLTLTRVVCKFYSKSYAIPKLICQMLYCAFDECGPINDLIFMNESVLAKILTVAKRVTNANRPCVTILSHLSFYIEHLFSLLILLLILIIRAKLRKKQRGRK